VNGGRKFREHVDSASSNGRRPGWAEHRIFREQGNHYFEFDTDNSIDIELCYGLRWIYDELVSPRTILKLPDIY
jgi:hypothetical protein